LLPSISVRSTCWPTFSKFGLSSTNFADRLLSKAEVAVVPDIAFGDDKTVRLSYATDLETIKTGLDRIEQFCRTI
jgi:aspartate aminotransferase